MNGRTLASLVAAFALAIPGTNAAQTTNSASHVAKAPMKICLQLDGKNLRATLNDSPAARDFAALLPLMLTLKDHAATEKISDLPRRLSTSSAPAGAKPSSGDIAFYAPWGNLAIFYRGADYAPGLIKLGQLDDGAAELSRAGSLQVTISACD